MSIFAISDLHLSLGEDKPMDIFDGWNNYVKRIENNWKKIVSDEDTVVIAGDISWAMKLDHTYEDLNFINKLPGKKLLIKGNHDLWWSTKTKIENYIKANNFNSIEIIFNSTKEVDNVCICGTRGWFYDSKSEEDVKILNREVGRLKKSISEAKSKQLEPLVFLHYPPVYNGVECKEILDVLVENNIKKCYYGHVHGVNASKKITSGLYKGINFTFISCDYNKFMPVLVK